MLLITVATTVSLARWPASDIAMRQDRQDLVAVDVVALVVDRQAAVGVAVEGEAGVGAVLEDRLLQRTEVGRAAAVVDVEPVGVGADRDDLGAGLLAGRADRRRTPRRGRSRATTLSPVERPGDGAEQVVDVLRRPASRRASPGRRRRRWAGPSRSARISSMAFSTASSSLRPPRARNLMPLSGIGLCEALMTTPRSAPSDCGQVGDPGGRQDPQAQHVDPGRREAGDDGVLEELPGDPGVPAHDRERTVALELAAVGEHPGRGDRQVERELRGQLAVGQTADPVGAEDPRHAPARISAC